MGIYSIFKFHEVTVNNAIQAPTGQAGVEFTNVFTGAILRKGKITNVINGKGDAVDTNNHDKVSSICHYPRKYLGCFEDTDAYRALPDYKGNGYDHAHCATDCSNYRYFALQYFGQCWCGSDLQRATQYGEKYGECGDRGKGWRNMLY